MRKRIRPAGFKFAFRAEKPLCLKAGQQIGVFRPRTEKVRLYTSYTQYGIKFVEKY
jgi:hypothetical protein